MKRLFICLLALLLLSACDLKNRRPSSDFIPDEDPPVYTTIPSTQPYTTAPKKPERSHGAAVVKQVFSEKGSYTDFYETVWNYDFRLPYVDIASTAANQINADIERTYRRAVSEQFSLMEELQPLTFTGVSYEVFENGEILTLLVRKYDAKNVLSYSAYNLNHITGDSVTAEELTAQAGLTTDEFLQQVTEQLSAEFERRFGQYASTDSLLYATQQQKTLADENCSLEMPMYLDADGVLNVIATLYCVGLVQGTDLYIIRLSR